MPLQPTKKPINKQIKTPTKIAIKKPVAKVNIPQKTIKPLSEQSIKKSGIFNKLNNFVINLSRVPLEEKLFFIEHLKVLVHAGLSLSSSLGTLASQTENKKFSKILYEMKLGIEKGETLSSNLAKFPKVFPKIFVSMVEAGELSGTLEQNLEQLTIQMKKEHNLRSKVKSALTYPIVVVIATIGIMIAMIIYVIPNIISIFDEVDAKLPLATRILISSNKFILENYIFVIIGIIVIAGLFIFVIRQPKGKSILHSCFLKAPIIGKITKKINLARFSRTLSSLLKTDIPVVKSFETTADILGNIHYKKIVLDAAQKLQKGVLIAESLKTESKLFPPLVLQMISIGEKSGNLDVLLEDLAVFYEEQVDDTIKSLSSIIEPLLILFLGLIIGGIAIAIISPIYSLSEAI